jgi:hypothetical protein
MGTRWIASLGSVFFLLGFGQSAAPLAAQEQAGLDSRQQTSQIPADTSRVTVQGIVRNSVTGEPLARALVQIEGDANTGTLTDGEGRFEIPGVPAGPQTFRIVKPGFRDRPYPTEEAGLQAEGPAHSVLVDAQMPELVFTLEPNCSIHGHIQLSTGDPADGMTVDLLKRTVRFGRAVWTMEANARANGDGDYRFGGLPDGVYAVYTLPALESEPIVSVVAAGSGANVARSGFPAVYYPDARDLAGASRIRLSGGSQAEANFSLTLEPFYPVTAFAGPQTDTPRAGETSQQATYTAVIMDGSGHLLPYTAQYDEATHSLQANLPDGSYSLVAQGARGIQLNRSSLTPLLLESHRGGFAGSVEFTVAGHAATGLRIPLSTPPAASVHLRFLHNSGIQASTAQTGNNAENLVNLAIDPADSVPQNTGEELWFMESSSDTITFTAQPGSYWLSVNLQRKGVCAGTFNAGSFNLAREPLAVSLAAAPPPMELTLSDDCGTLALTLPPALATFLPGEEPFFTVYVVPDFDTVQDLPPMTVHPSSGPTLTLDGLAPGSYHIYMFDSPVHLEYRNPAVLSALPNPGQQVTVTAGTTTSLVLEAPEH